MSDRITAERAQACRSKPLLREFLAAPVPPLQRRPEINPDRRDVFSSDEKALQIFAAFLASCTFCVTDISHVSVNSLGQKVTIHPLQKKIFLHSIFVFFQYKFLKLFESRCIKMVF